MQGEAIISTAVGVQTVTVWELVAVMISGGGVSVEKMSLVCVVVTVVWTVVEVTMVEVESRRTITGSWVKVMTAKKAAPGGVIKSD